VRRARILQLIEENGKVLEGKYRKKQELSKKFNFNPSKKINDLIESIKKAIERNNKKGSGGSSGGGRSGRNKNTSDTDNSDSEDDYSSDDENNTGNGGDKNDKDSNPFKNNHQLIIITGIALLVIFYLLNQKQEKAPNYYNF
jgi:hypothetical protein